jgi:hypothetical protein
MGISPLLKGYFPEGSFVWLTFCYSAWLPLISCCRPRGTIPTTGTSPSSHGQNWPAVSGTCYTFCKQKNNLATYKQGAIENNCLLLMLSDAGKLTFIHCILSGDGMQKIPLASIKSAAFVTFHTDTQVSSFSTGFDYVAG